MRILICDDEKLYVNDIYRNVLNFFNEKRIKITVDTFFNSSFVNENVASYDIAFLDIEMQPVNGIEVAAILREKNPNIILFFITAYTQYLDDAFDLNAFRFLSKPLDVKRLFEGLTRMLKKIDVTDKRLAVDVNHTQRIIKSSEIIMVEIDGKNTRITTVNGIFQSKNNISYWKEKLNMSFFYQTHKSFIINSNYITDYGKDMVTLCGKYKAMISHRNQSDFKKYIMALVERR